VGWLELENPDQKHWFEYEALRKRLPETINPWEMFREVALEEDLSARTKRPIAGWVKLSTGQTIQSKPLLL
jgi:DNA primase